MISQQVDERLIALSHKKYPLLQTDGAKTLKRKETKRQLYYREQVEYLNQYPESAHKTLLDELEINLVIVKSIGGCGC